MYTKQFVFFVSISSGKPFLISFLNAFFPKFKYDVIISDKSFSTQR